VGGTHQTLSKFKSEQKDGFERKLKATKMTKSETIASYLTRITQVRDELAAIGEEVEKTELVRLTLQGLPKNWEVFVEGIIAKENLPDWERLWDDCIQNEIRRNSNGAAKHCG
jgi:hypothetical protein